MAFITLVGEYTSTGTTEAACVMHAISPSTMPKQWKKGTVMHSLSSLEKFMPSPIALPLLRMLKCVSMTPLGKPVVPLVYCMFTTSWQSSPAVSSR